MSASAARAARRRRLEPMYASVGKELPEGADWTFEPKYDGVRVLAFATPGAAVLVTRNGKDKSAQFPGIVAALRSLAARRRRELVLDGEIVALHDGRPARFQQLQARMHVQDRAAIARHERETPAALLVFDLLVDGDDIVIDDAWRERRALLERRMRGAPAPLVLGETARDAKRLMARARREGWEGLIAKRVDAAYHPGERSRAWQKLKLEQRQEFVVGGWTEPRLSRPHLGALLLGYYEGDRLVYAGHMGGGFTHQALEDMHRRLRRLEQRTPPFEAAPRTNEPAHWVRPEVVVEVRFNEWTADGKLRQPIFLGVRDDKDAREVTREPTSVQRRGRRGAPRQAGSETNGRRATSSGSAMARRKTSGRKSTRSKTPRGGSRRASARRTTTGSTTRRKSTAKTSTRKGKDAEHRDIEAQLRRIERGDGEGELSFRDGRTLRVTSLGKIFFPEPGFTKGDLLRYYARVSPFLLPLIADRPLALRRFPDGVDGFSFYQQNAGEHVPDAVRVEAVADAKGDREPRFIGGDLVTLLYTVQLGSIDVHAWLSRLGSLDAPDHAVLDLDPAEGVQFGAVVRVARAIRRELDDASLTGAVKTSGSRGMHVAIPLSGGLGWSEAAGIARAIAGRVHEREPEITTMERRLKARPAGSIYLDWQQNARGKTVASAYAVRARAGGTISFPTRWSALRADLDPSRYTLKTTTRQLDASSLAWAPELSLGNSVRRLRSLLEE